MAIHKKIVLTGEPKGRVLEGTISGTPKPGTMMQIKAATEPVGGRLTWEVFNGTADGERTLVAILCENWFLGKDVTTAYADGERGPLYCPIMGDELLVLLQNQAGTADAFAIGDKLIVDDTTGLFIDTTGSPESEPFIIMETIAAITADTLAHVIYTGH